MELIRGYSTGKTRRGRREATLALGLALVMATGCTVGDRPPPGPTEVAAPGGPTIAQPAVPGLSVAPEARRVDLAMPTFSRPTEVTNPLFPVSDQRSVVMLGRVDGRPFRTEVTLLPETRIIEWNGVAVETLVSQYAAFLDGRIHEVAYDYYAQDDRGAVWYFGEDVFNFADGAIVDTHGTWTAGVDGPAAMIMPADPRVGDAYRPENIPGLVFEEVTVRSVDRSLPGPLGPVDGGLVIEELHMDGTTEGKSFAPGYGEFRTAGGGDVEALTLAVPTDSMGGPTPQTLRSIERGATATFDAAGSGSWRRAGAAVRDMSAAWAGYEAHRAPAGISTRLQRSLDGLSRAVTARSAHDARQAAIDAARWVLDLQLRHRPAVAVDLARLKLWARQLQVDAAAGDAASVNGDLFSLDYVRDRVVGSMSLAEQTRMNTTLEELQGAVADGDLDAASEIAASLTG
jgi:hypothetical protein